ncbi:hypothetical protein SCLCIDRAFT_100952, partial [Scleroderma citrinum Foug A]
NERPFYATRAHGFEPRYTLFTCMDEMVSAYAAAVKCSHPVAKCSEAMGDEVKFTSLINIPLTSLTTCT